MPTSKLVGLLVLLFIPACTEVVDGGADARPTEAPQRPRSRTIDGAPKPMPRNPLKAEIEEVLAAEAALQLKVVAGDEVEFSAAAHALAEASRRLADGILGNSSSDEAAWGTRATQRLLATVRPASAAELAYRQRVAQTVRVLLQDMPLAELPYALDAELHTQLAADTAVARSKIHYDRRGHLANELRAATSALCDCRADACLDPTAMDHRRLTLALSGAMLTEDEQDAVLEHMQTAVTCLHRRARTR